MLAINNINQPTSDSRPYYPDRWLPDGTPFEFRRPPRTHCRVRRHCGDIWCPGLVLCGIVPGEMLLKRTEGRVNITEKMSALPNEGGEQIETAGFLTEIGDDPMGNETDVGERT